MVAVQPTLHQEGFIVSFLLMFAAVTDLPPDVRHRVIVEHDRLFGISHAECPLCTIIRHREAFNRANRAHDNTDPARSG